MQSYGTAAPRIGKKPVGKRRPGLIERGMKRKKRKKRARKSK